MDPIVAQLILQDQRIAYAITDRRLKVLEVAGAVDILRTNGGISVGQSLLDWIPELAGSEAVLTDILAGELPRYELAWVNRETAEGQTVYLTMVDLPHRDGTGCITGLIHLVEDVTEVGTLQQRLAQHRNELSLLRDQLTLTNRELAAANVELQRLDELKSVFVSVAAHELRSPLSAILAYAEVLLDEEMGPLNNDQREYLETVQSSTQRLRTITNELLDVTRIEAGRVELLLQPTELTALVEAVASEFESQLHARSQRLTLRADSVLPPVLCDETRASQIIRNLLSNASKYTLPGGLLTVKVSAAEENGFVQVSVADSGVGISAKDQVKVFERFFRAESAQLTGANGTGMGLYITRSLVELHGGRIWFESTLGKGSTFHVTFPIADGPP